MLGLHGGLHREFGPCPARASDVLARSSLLQDPRSRLSSGSIPTSLPSIEAQLFMRNPLIALGTMLLASCAALGAGNSKDMVYVVEASGGA